MQFLIIFKKSMRIYFEEKKMYALKVALAFGLLCWGHLIFNNII